MGSPPQNNPTAGQNAGGAGGGGNKVKVTAPVAFGLSAAFKSEASFPHGEHVFVADVKKQFVDTDFVDPDRDLAVEKKGDKFEFKGAFASGPEADWIKANKGKKIKLAEVKIVLRDASKLDPALIAGYIQDAPVLLVEH